MSNLYTNNQLDYSYEDSNIIEVWADNFEDEINSISEIISKYNYVAIDTEFPGTIHSVSTKLKDYNYRSLKTNVDDLNMIQFGLTLSDEKGNFPEGSCTWQFNMKFDLEKEKHSMESINLLTNSGLDFKKHAKDGIDPQEFGNLITCSGLVLFENIKWIAFHGTYDFAYFIKVLTNRPLPETESEFLNLLKIYCPTIYDVRHIIRNYDLYSKSLQKLAQELDVERKGIQHQAGSDSQVTSLVFYKLIKNNTGDINKNDRNYNPIDLFKNDKNILFGLGHFYEDDIHGLFNESNKIPLNINNIGSYNNINPTSKLQPNLNLNSNFQPLKMNSFTTNPNSQTFNLGTNNTNMNLGSFNNLSNMNTMNNGTILGNNTKLIGNSFNGINNTNLNFPNMNNMNTMNSMNSMNNIGNQNFNKGTSNLQYPNNMYYPNHNSFNMNKNFNQYDYFNSSTNDNFKGMNNVNMNQNYNLIHPLNNVPNVSNNMNMYNPMFNNQNFNNMGNTNNVNLNSGLMSTSNIPINSNVMYMNRGFKNQNNLNNDENIDQDKEVSSKFEF